VSSIQTYSDETGNYITGFGISTKLNDALWTIDRETGHNLVKQWPGHHFAIIPELINKPIRLGGGGHYWGNDTYEDLLKGYEKHSHGIITKLRGPFYYNDGTDDYRYNFDIKLRDSKAASALREHGQNTWVPFAISPHIWPISGPDTGYTNWKPIGAALVIRGAYGDESTINKLCTGTEKQCDEHFSVAGSTVATQEHNIMVMNKMNTDLEKLVSPTLCPTEDSEMAKIISSYVSKSASTKIEMEGKNPDASTGSAIGPPVVTNLTPDKTTSTTTTNPTVDSQTSIINSPKESTTVFTVERGAQLEKENADLKKAVTELKNKDKLNTINTMFVKIKDEKLKQQLVEKYMKYDNVDQIRDIVSELYPIFKSSDEEVQKDKEEEEGDTSNEEEQPQASKAKKNKSKAGSSILTPESALPSGESNTENNNTESKAASTTVPNKAKEIVDFLNSGGRFY